MHLDRSPRSADPATLVAFERRLDRARAAEGTPGINAAALVDDDVIWRYAVGLATVAPTAALTPRHAHQIGSITKLFTAHAILMLRDEGRLGLDDPVADYIPEFAAAGAERVTLRHVLCHGGGIPTNGGINAWIEGVFPDRDQFRELIRSLPVVQEPMTTAKYSNAGYSMLGLVIDAASGMPYERFLRERLLEPLGMTRAGFDPSRAEPFAPGHVVVPHDATYERAPHHELNAWNACGMLVATPADTLQIARLQWQPQGPIAPSTLDEMHRLQLLDYHESAPQGDWSLGYGLGWRLVRRGDRVLAGHGGGYVGNRCQIAVSWRDRAAVAVFANGNQALGTTDVAFSLLEDLVAALPPAAAETTVPDAELHERVQPLLGHYFARYWHGVHVTWCDGLALTYETDPGNAVALTPLADDRYRIEAGRDAGEELIVRRQADGRVDEILLAGMIHARV